MGIPSSCSTSFTLQLFTWVSRYQITTMAVTINFADFFQLEREKPPKTGLLLRDVERVRLLVVFLVDVFCRAFSAAASFFCLWVYIRSNQVPSAMPCR